MNVDEQQLRLTLNRLLQRNRYNELYPALLEMLDRKSLVFTWEGLDGQPIRVWSVKVDATIREVAPAVKDELTAVLLGMFVENNLVFTTDLKTTPEVRWRAGSALSKHICSTDSLQISCSA